MKKYKPSEIERKWQTKWRDTKIFSPDIDKSKKPYYALMMFPYPSAEGLHVGNMLPFTAVDVVARYKRMSGYDVFEPIGLDSFGIHTENYALKINKHPKEVTKQTGQRFYDQLLSIGNSFDWTRTLETHEPEYYKWTQWIFVQMYKEGLAVQKEANVNWCPSCKTVLADEQVISGRCERCNTEVEQKLLKQWFFKITEYADKLLENLNSDTWSERIRQIQTNWIGRSEGTVIKFDEIEVFTTRPDTIFGATFLVISPEYPAVNKLTTPDQKQEVEKYIKQAKNKTEIERQEAKDKTGVFTGSYVKNPLTSQSIPVWVADYVLMGYGTGAIMAVPAHDDRDKQFADKYNLPIKVVITEQGILKDSGEFNGLESNVAKDKLSEYIEGNHIGSRKTQYHLRDWLISRQRYWGPPIPVIYCDKCGVVPVPEEQLPVLLPEVADIRPTGTGKSPLASIESFVNTSCPKCGAFAKRETDVSDNFLDSAWYFLRYPSVRETDQIFDQEITKEWLPVDLYIGGFEHALLHLMYTRFTTMVFKRVGLIDFEEPFKKFIDNGHILSEGMKMSKSKGNVINPDDYIKEYGADTLRMYLMFLSPLTAGGDFRKEAVGGVYRFLQRVWSMVLILPEKEASRQEKTLLNQTIKVVGEDIDTAIHFNTAIARMMELLNLLSKQGSADKETKKSFLKILAPFAPHITEELWEMLGENYSIHQQPWPEVDQTYLVSDQITVVVQVNGKLRESLLIGSDIVNDKEKVEELALNSPKISQLLAGTTPKRLIYIPGRVVNIVI